MFGPKAVLFKSQYRVLVLRDAKPAASHEKVLSILLEHNLVGRGATLTESLEDLKATIWEYLKEKREDLLPAGQAAPDPELVRAFTDWGAADVDGDAVLQRLILGLEVVAVSTLSKGKRLSPIARPRMVFEGALASV